MNEFKNGLKDGIPIALGYFAVTFRQFLPALQMLQVPVSLPDFRSSLPGERSLR